MSDALSADDGLDQRVINGALTEGAYDSETQRQKFKDVPFRRVRLSELRANFEGNKTRRALNLMSMRTEIKIDDEYLHKHDNPNLAWDMSKHYLDFLLVQSASIGFHAILPRVANDLTFIFHLDLHQPCRTFTSKYVDLDFSPDRRLLYIGRSRGKDEVWLAMAPAEYFLKDQALPRHARMAVLPTSLEGSHYWMLVMLFAYFLNRKFPGGSIYCTVPYPDLESNPRQNVAASTNIL